MTWGVGARVEKYISVHFRIFLLILKTSPIFHSSLYLPFLFHLVEVFTDILKFTMKVITKIILAVPGLEGFFLLFIASINYYLSIHLFSLLIIFF